MKISHVIFLGFLFILIMFPITTYINYRQAEKVNENSGWFAKSTTVMQHGNRFQRVPKNDGEALEYLHEVSGSGSVRPDIILLDLNMPKMNGILSCRPGSVKKMTGRM